MARWHGAALSAGTALTSANVNTTGNGDTVALGFSGTWTAVMATGGGVDITAAASGILRFDLPRTATKFGRQQNFYTPKETPSATLALHAFRNSGAAAATGVHYSDGKYGYQNAAAATIAGASTPVALIVGHRYQIDQWCVVGTTTGNGRYFHLITDTTDPTWNGTGDFFYESGYTQNVGTTDITQHRSAKVGTPAMTVGMRVEQIGWDAPTSVDATLTRAAAVAQFMAAPTTTVTQSATVAMTGDGTLDVAPAVTELAAVSMVGASSMGVVPATTRAGVVPMVGAGTLAATATTVGIATSAAPIVGAGTLAVAPTVTHPAAVSMSGAGTLSVVGTRATAATVALTGGGTLTVTGQQTISPNAAPDVAVESVTSASALTVTAAGSLTFAHTVNPAVTLLVVAVQASASSGLSTVATAYYAGLPMIRQTNALSSAGTTAREAAIFVLPNPPVGTANVQLPARSSGTTYTIAGTAISLTGTSGLYGTPATAVSASATSISDSTTSPASSLVITSASIRSTTTAAGGAGTSRYNTVLGTNNAFAVNTAAGATSLANTYTWPTADNAAIVSLPVAAATAVVLAGTGTMGISAAGSQTATVPLVGTSTLTVTGTDTTAGTIALSGVGTLAATGVLAQSGAAINLAGSGTLTATPTAATTTTVPLAGAGTLTVAGTPARTAAVPIVGSGALDTAGTSTLPATIPLTGAGDLTVAGTLIGNIRSSLALEGVGQLAVAARDEQLATLLLIGSGTLGIEGQELPPTVSGPSVHFAGGPYVHRLAFLGPLIQRTTLGGPYVARFSLTGPEVR